MERLTKETLLNAINTYKTVIEAVDGKDTDYCPVLDKVTVTLLEELKAYRDAEELGLLLRLPCKVGDTVYLIDFEENDYDEAIIEEIIIGKNGIFINSDYEIGTPLNADYVTLTEEEAEQKLESMKGE